MEWTVFVTVGLLIGAAMVDVFFLTGVWFSGTFLLVIAGTLYTRGDADFWLMVPAVFIGSLVANCGNFYLGRHGSHLPLIKKQLQKDRAQRVRDKLKGLTPRSLFITMFVCRFIGVIRPFYGIVLGAASVSPTRFIQNELVLAAVWTLVWSAFIYAVTNGILAVT